MSVPPIGNVTITPKARRRTKDRPMSPRRRFAIRHNDVAADRERRQEDERVMEPLAPEAPWLFDPAVELRPGDEPARQRRRADSELASIKT